MSGEADNVQNDQLINGLFGPDFMATHNVECHKVEHDLIQHTGSTLKAGRLLSSAVIAFKVDMCETARQ